jgi:hypothetical protein
MEIAKIETPFTLENAEANPEARVRKKRRERRRHSMITEKE